MFRIEHTKRAESPRSSSIKSGIFFFLFIWYQRVSLNLTLMSNYLKDWGFTVQRPAKSAYQRDDKKVQEWLEKTYPKIQEEAKRKVERDRRGNDESIASISRKS